MCSYGSTSVVVGLLGNVAEVLVAIASLIESATAWVETCGNVVEKIGTSTLVEIISLAAP